MKRCLTFLCAAALCLSLGTTSLAAYDEETDYLAIMMEAALTGDYETGNAAQAARDEKIAVTGQGQSISFEDLYLVAKVMYSEAGSEWLSDEWKMCVGEVVLNRVASPEFPNTVREVVYQPGQYGNGSRYWESLMPSERCVELALRLLQGERLMEPAVVFQANFRQGSGVHTHMYDSLLGSTYFCYSNHMELYEDAEILGDAQEIVLDEFLVC